MSATSSAKELARALERSKEAGKIAAAKPSWDDYVREGVIAHAPEPGPDGTMNAQVNGHGAVVRMWEMNCEHYLKQADYSEARQAAKPRVVVRGAGGHKRMVLEAHAERVERKFFQPGRSFSLPTALKGWQYRCGRGHTFGFLPGRPDADSRPCVHQGCNGRGLLEVAS